MKPNVFSEQFMGFGLHLHEQLGARFHRMLDSHQYRLMAGVASIYQKFFEKMIELLNKYGMLFESTPKGYSNVEMRSIN